HLRAEMRRLEPNGDAARSNEFFEQVCDLLAEALLHREAARVQADEPRQLRDADDLGPGDVPDVRNAEKGKRVVLAERMEDDRSLDDLAVGPVDGGRPLAREHRPQLGIS